MFWVLVIAYVLGGLTMVPLVLLFAVAIIIYTSTPVGDSDPTKPVKAELASSPANSSNGGIKVDEKSGASAAKDLPQTAATAQRVMQGWLIARRTFFETQLEGSYVNNMVRSFLDARSKDPKRARPRDTFFAVLKDSVLFLYEDEGTNEYWAAIDMSSHNVSIYYPANDTGDSIGATECTPMLDGELFSRRNSILLRVRPSEEDRVGSKTVAVPPSVTEDMAVGTTDEVPEAASENETGASGDIPQEAPKLTDENEAAADQATTREEAFDQTRPWFLFIRGMSQMEDWYLALQHASTNSPGVPRLTPLLPVFSSTDMDVLVTTLDHQADPIPMRWLNALIGRLFFGVYRTARIEEFIMSRVRRKLAKIKRPSFLTDIMVREASVGSTPPMFSKPMLKELTKEGEASVELGFHYKGEFKIIVEATATINLGPRFKSYAVKILLAIVLKEIDGNLLLRMKTPPSNRIWYAFTSTPKLELEVQPVVSDRQIKWSMILKPIESMLKDAIQDSVVLPNMDDIPFFDTSDYAVRGGIFPEAKRHDQSANLDEIETPGKSARSPPQNSQSLSHPEASEKQTRIGELVMTGIDRADNTTSLPSLALGEEAEPIAALSSSNRRSTWFMSPKKDQQHLRRGPVSDVASDDTNIPSNDGSELPPLGFPTPPDVDRGDPGRDNRKIPATDTSDEQAPSSYEGIGGTPPFDTSVSSGAPSSLPFSAAVIPGNDPEGLRSVSAQSHRSTMSSDMSFGPSSRSSTKVDSDDSGDDRPNTSKMSAASTLIANWKTKAAEKQLGATARETMKRWGWGAGSRTRGGSPSIDNLTGASASSKPTLSKQSYAEMRAQVEGRRQAELSQQSHALRPVESSHNPLSPGSGVLTTETLETPAEMPGELVDSRKRTLSSSSSLTRRNSNTSSKGYTGGMSPLASPRLNATDATPPTLSARHISPSLPKATTEVSHLSLTSTPTPPPPSSVPSSIPSLVSSTPFLVPGDSVKRRSSTSPNPSLPDVDPSVRARTVSSRSTSGNSPILAAQPASAAMMTIPAIHASRRGEIMALGSSPTPAVSPGPAPESQKIVPRLGASFQNVYRMFNVNGIIGSNKTGAVSESPQAVVAGAPSSNYSVASSEALSGEDANRPTKVQPPPLPPRKPMNGVFAHANGQTNPGATSLGRTVPNQGVDSVLGKASIPVEKVRTADLESTIAIKSLPLEPHDEHDEATNAGPSLVTVPDDGVIPSAAAGGGSGMGCPATMSDIAPERPAMKAAPEDDQPLLPEEGETATASASTNAITRQALGSDTGITPSPFPR